MNKLLIPAALTTAMLSGCMFTSPGYECELKPNPQGKCASMQQAYTAAGAVQRTTAIKKRESVFEQADSTGDRREARQPVFDAADSGLPDTPESGMPVFRQPKVMRVWVAPYVDADGNLRSGEYTYFTTPGQWNYGSLHKPGDASASFGPARAGGNLGFNPITDKPKVTPPPAPPPGQNGAVNMPIQNGKPVEKQGPATVDGVTQPAQRF
ncbi:type IV conjugative transfer system lipoprotein TraV [Paraburkholderia sp. UCT31]|uniref:type IV conjugative transfer system lipoprotein TraV n=1 Tax=Paraburkholderia sp. UCT31 TaxID=2615209 RepID=UPI0016554D19|nr:type IV conjugative transfer system lipoprotein TraV [Paraburkholderia sp. UCT31]MBC8737240.1 type IV conjugative transfer system lipoprotein TraV [Paraburkholderia sp. UCT31]